MKTMTFKYPGDPPAEIVEMSREEFLTHYPRTPILIISSKGRKKIPAGHDEIACDSCSNDPGETVFVVYGTRGYCRRCAERYILPYVENRHEG